MYEQCLAWPGPALLVAASFLLDIDHDSEQTAHPLVHGALLDRENHAQVEETTQGKKQNKQ